MAGWWAVISVILVSSVSLAGLASFYLDEKRLNSYLHFLVSLSVGAMFGDAFIHLLPEAFAHASSPMETPSYLLAGLFLFFLMEKFLRWRHQHIPHCDSCVEPLGYANLVADGVHNFIDGLLIGAAYLISIPIGIATSLAVLMHEIPQEISDFAVLLHAGFSRSRALLLNGFCALLSVVGVLVALAAGGRVNALAQAMLPITAGGFIYIAGCDLVPELHRQNGVRQSLLQCLGITLGTGVMLLLRQLR